MKYISFPENPRLLPNLHYHEIMELGVFKKNPEDNCFGVEPIIKGAETFRKSWLNWYKIYGNGDKRKLDNQNTQIWVDKKLMLEKMLNRNLKEYAQSKDSEEKDRKYKTILAILQSLLEIGIFNFNLSNYGDIRNGRGNILKYLESGF